MIRDAALQGMDPAAASLVQAMADEQKRMQQQLAALTGVVTALAEQKGLPAQGTHKCPRFGCQWSLTPQAGRWPKHEMAVGPSGRRNGPMCPMSGQPVEQMAVAQ